MDKLNLQTALKLASRVTERRSAIPILSCVRFAGGAVQATDLDTQITIDVEGLKGPRDGVAILLRPLSEAVKAGIEDVTFDDKAGIFGNNPTVRIARTDGDWPTIAKWKPDVSFELPANELAADLANMAAAMASEETRYYLMGVCWEVADGKLLFSATDGHRMHRITQAAPKGSEKMPRVIVPKKAIRVLAEMLKLGKGSTVKIGISPTMASFSLGVVKLETKLIDGPFPAVEKVIPTSKDNGFSVEAAALIAPASLASSILGEGSVAVKVDIKGRTLSARDPEGTEIEAAVALKPFGEPPEYIGFRHTYLVDCLNPFAGGRVTMSAPDNSSPVLIEGEGNDRLIVVLMPMRI